ncbi:hypothetical protein [Halorubrum vacuolatum]|uniref:Uncharacterized protein n=1 Tax=Halorubrum vacuolatum TaxID=63740 RepID=A0A238WC82_HALVU|nr:hypothetical protein [Halorubrum vacuolatum]SNR44186.1 hypothetical protein SAMN06264855_10716 [Halorubrum vacuolatum]
MVHQVTIFETDFDGAQFGGAQYGSDSPERGEADAPELETADSPGVEPTRTDGGSAGEEIGDENPGKSRRTKFLQGMTVFVVMFVTMYTVLRWALSRDEARAE